VNTNKSVVLYAVLTFGVSVPGWAQVGQYQPYYQQPQAPAYQPQAPGVARWSPQELSNLAAPIALYPDLLLSQVLAASTYPAEITQAQQWMQSNPSLRGQELVEAAKQQPWDPSVQALVAFPDVMNMLARDIQWTTDLGNAFLEQQAGVMDAIQQLRASARNNGRLGDTPQQRVELEQVGNGQDAIEIQPTNPQMVYPPVYNPEYVWGAPAYGAYPALGYPAAGDGIVYGIGTFLGGLFSGLLNFGGWGWGLSWLTHGLFWNGLFFNHFGFHGYGGYGGGFGGPGFGGPGYATHLAWVHNPSHRLGVPYSNGNRFAVGGFSGRGYGAQNYRGNYSGGAYAGGRSAINYAGGNRQMEAYRGLTGGGYVSGYRGGNYGGGYGGYSQARYSSTAYAAQHSYAGMGFQGGYRGGYSNAVSSGRAFSAPRASFGGGRSFSGPHYSPPKSSGHFGGGGHSHAGGGHGHSGGSGHSHAGGGHKK